MKNEIVSSYLSYIYRYYFSDILINYGKIGSQVSKNFIL